LTSTDDVIFAFGDDGADLCTVIVSLMKKDSGERIVRNTQADVYIRFDIFKVSIL
jgi:hypothetical protein